MDQNLNSQKEFLGKLLANPASDAHPYHNDLLLLVDNFPQSGVLRALLAYAADEKELSQAAVYFRADNLYKLLNAPAAFNAVPTEKIIFQHNIPGNGNAHDQQTSVNTGENYFSDQNDAGTGIDDDKPISAAHETAQSLVTDHSAMEGDSGIWNNHTIDAPALVYEIETVVPETGLEATGIYGDQPVEGYTDGTLAVSLLTPENQVGETAYLSETEAHPGPRDEQGHRIEEETFDEITGIESIGMEADEVVSSAGSTDHIIFDRTAVEDVEIPQLIDNQAAAPAIEQANENHQQDLSKYHDEKMPYTFMWWLDKTRREHSGIFQPYVVSRRVKPAVADPAPGTAELQQQYYENIFHLTSIEELDKKAPATPPASAAPEPKRKEDKIIERFIQEEPQIRPQSSDKLDNENKARKSAEDHDELVTETLAAIYTDQMLYHKAIDSYKKLMLKFPEKSRYFAAKIEQLEKKTN